ncbi:MAG: 3-deoxy-D-manno-octulosonic acid transferase [Bacteroidetes bacterium HGW-Bacteroidetes-22]|nr:MAG: 3-deoxy-D-manno-octulosonic acid transferase [Bacteroidetes bacterium HGW-Bacteroidetes-22]
MMLLYNLTINGYTAAVRFASHFNPKARLWVEGRHKIIQRIQEAMKTNQQRVVWVHCASLGEFEQGRPVIEAIRKQHPAYKILLTFFSPSGYEVRKNYTGADYVFYLPADTPANAREFIAAAKPAVAIFIKYEFWFNFMKELRHNNIPIIIISAIFRPGHHFFGWYGFWFLKQLIAINRFYVQNESSGELLRRNGITQVVVSGDTRFDRVKEVAAQEFSHPVIEAFASGNQVLIAGSTWPPDEELIVALMKKPPINLRLLIAPHEVDQQRIEQLVKEFGKGALRLSKANPDSAREARVLIVDNVGMLSQLYRYGHYAYIGGGFGVGTHNILEAATFGLPLFFGPNHQKFRETIDLIRLRGAFPVSSIACFLSIFEKVASDNYIYQQAHAACLDYIARNTGATEIIMTGLKGYLQEE